MKVNGTNISMIRGDSETITVLCKDQYGTLVDLIDGDTVRFTIKENINTEIKTLQKTVTTFPDGIAVITIVPADTKTLKFKEYVYDVQLTRADQSVITIVPPSKFKIEVSVVLIGVTSKYPIFLILKL